MSARAEVTAALAMAYMELDKARDLANLTDAVPLAEYAEIKRLRRETADLYRRLSNAH